MTSQEIQAQPRRAATLAAPLLAMAALCLAPNVGAQTRQGPLAVPTPPPEQQTPQPAASVAARGKKLVLKDGSIQIVREYQVHDDRVRFYSLDRSQWEEIPGTLVDWDATGKAAAEDARRDAAILEKVHADEQTRHAEALDIDASLEVAPGLFLPPGEGIFAFDGKGLATLTPAEAASKVSKGREVEKVLSPVPVVPTRQIISLAGARATLRIRSPQPEFYMRTADAREPEMKLIRAKVRGNSRRLEKLDTLFGAEEEKGQTVPMQRMEIARGVYRFVFGEPLEPGEYVLAEIVQGEGMSLYVWDFGVDETEAPDAAKRK